MPSDEWNPQGYWEHLPLIRFNQKLLESVNSNWFVPPCDDELLKKRATESEYRKQVLELITVMQEESHVWFWKDPRLAILLPCWMELWQDVTFIIPVRQPLDTAISLQRIYEFPLSASLLLWQYSIAKILHYTQDCSIKFFIHYEKLIQKPYEQSERICRFLDSQCGYSDGQMIDRIEKMSLCVNTKLRRIQSQSKFSEATLATGEQKALYKRLQARMKDPDEKFYKHHFILYSGWREYLETVQKYLQTSSRLRKHKASRSYRLSRALTWPLR